MEWIIKPFQELTLQELYSILQLRSSVFVVEQNCPYQDIDGNDEVAHHLFLKEGQAVLACLRILPAGVTFDQAALGRIVVDPKQRGKDYGRELLRRGIAFAEEQWQVRVLKIEAQSYLQKFYESFGFVQTSQEFLEDGIPHIEMLRATPQK